MAKPTKVSGASLKHAFREIIWPRRKLVALGLLLILMNRMAGLVLPASTKYLMDESSPRDINLLYTLLGWSAPRWSSRPAPPTALTMLLSVEAQHLIAQLRSQVQSTFFNFRSGSSTIPRAVSWSPGSWTTSRESGTWWERVWSNWWAEPSRPWWPGVPHPDRSRHDRPGRRASGRLRPGVHPGLQNPSAGLPGAGGIRAEVTGRLTEALGGVRIIKGFHAVEKEGEIFEAGVLRIFDNVKKTLTTSSGVTSLGTFLMGLASVLVMGYGGSQIVQGNLTLGDLFSFTLFLGFLIAPIIQMANIGTQMTEAFAGLDRTAELLSWPREDDDPGEPSPCRPSTGTSFSRTSTSATRRTNRS